MGFGKFMLGLSLLGFIGTNLNNAVIGRMLGVVSLGYFALAANIGNFINTHFTHLISRVMFPAYSSIQGDREALKRAFLKTCKFISIVSLPFAILLITLSKEFVMTLYGEKWLSIIPLIRIFGFIQLSVPIVACSGSVCSDCWGT